MLFGVNIEIAGNTVWDFKWLKISVIYEIKRKDLISNSRTKQNKLFSAYLLRFAKFEWLL